jgi:hypothetical protein
MIENPAVARARDLVLAYGWNSTSFQIVNPGIKSWFSEDGEAVAGYVPAAGFRVRPAAWEPVFAVSNETRVSFRTLYAIASAFSGKAPFRLLFDGLWKAGATEIKCLRRRLVN